MRQSITERLDHVLTVTEAITGKVPPAKLVDFLTIVDLFKRWVVEAKPTKASITECEYSVRRFGELLGAIPVDKVTKAHIRQFREAALQTPSRLSNEESKVPLPELLKRYAGKDVPRAAPVTVRKRLSFIKTLFNRAVDAGLIEENHTDGIRIKDMGTKQSRLTFSDVEIVGIVDGLENEDKSFRWQLCSVFIPGREWGRLFN